MQRRSDSLFVGFSNVSVSAGCAWRITAQCQPSYPVCQIIESKRPAIRGLASVQLALRRASLHDHTRTHGGNGTVGADSLPLSLRPQPLKASLFMSECLNQKKILVVDDDCIIVLPTSSLTAAPGYAVSTAAAGAAAG